MSTLLWPIPLQQERGLWGDGTSTAFDKFVSSYDLENNSEVAVFRSLLSKVKVPSSFAIPPKKVAKTQMRQD